VAETTTSEAGQQTTSQSAPPAAALPPTVQVTCPSEVVFGGRASCSIAARHATSGRWEIPGLVDRSLPLEMVPGDSDVFIEPQTPDLIGQTFELTATVLSEGGEQASTTHRFEIVGPWVAIECPETIDLGALIECDIVSTNAVGGQWSITDFGAGELETVPGTHTIYIEPTNPSAVGRTFTVTATVFDADGRSVEQSSTFTVTGG
jgi:hypothetical protein